MILENHSWYSPLTLPLYKESSMCIWLVKNPHKRNHSPVAHYSCYNTCLSNHVSVKHYNQVILKRIVQSTHVHFLLSNQLPEFCVDKIAVQYPLIASFVKNIISMEFDKNPVSLLPNASMPCTYSRMSKIKRSN